MGANECLILFPEMSELLFECYHVPKVAYGVDALFSLLNNHPNPGKGTQNFCQNKIL